MAYGYRNNVLTVSMVDELDVASADIDAIGKGGKYSGLGAGASTIQLSSIITLDDMADGTSAAQNANSGTSAPLTGDSGLGGPTTVVASAQLHTLNLSNGIISTINGAEMAPEDSARAACLGLTGERRDAAKVVRDACTARNGAEIGTGRAA